MSDDKNTDDQIYGAYINGWTNSSSIGLDLGTQEKIAYALGRSDDRKDRPPAPKHLVLEMVQDHMNPIKEPTRAQLAALLEDITAKYAEEMERRRALEQRCDGALHIASASLNRGGDKDMGDWWALFKRLRNQLQGMPSPDT